MKYLIFILFFKKFNFFSLSNPQLVQKYPELNEMNAKRFQQEEQKRSSVVGSYQSNPSLKDLETFVTDFIPNEVCCFQFQIVLKNV